MERAAGHDTVTGPDTGISVSSEFFTSTLNCWPSPLTRQSAVGPENEIRTNSPLIAQVSFPCAGPAAEIVIS